MPGDIVVDIGAREAEHGPNDRDVENLTERTDAMKAGDAGAPEEIEKKRLYGIITVVSCGKTLVTMFRTDRGEEAVAQVACSLLDAETVAVGMVCGIERRSEELDTVFFSQLTNKVLIADAVPGTEIEVTMSDGERDAGTMEQMRHAYGVTPATDSQQHLAP